MFNSLSNVRMNVPLFDATRQYERLRDGLLAAIERVLASGRYILGEEVATFEQEVAAYLGVKHAIGVASGTDALWLSLKAVGVGPGDYVLIPPFTFFATASAVLNTGAVPVFVDIDARTFNLDPVKVEKALAGGSAVWRRLNIDSKQVKCMIPVHLYGQPADMDELLDIARRHNLWVIEDTAQAMGAIYKGKKAGTLGDLGVFSFFPTKNLGGFGDGGLVVTNNDDLAEKVRMLRAHGSQRKYYHVIIGTNSRLDELQAALLRVKLRYLEEWIERRRTIAATYTEALQNIEGIEPPYEMPGRRHTYHQYTVRVRNGKRDEFQDWLRKQGVGTAIYYPRPVHLQKAVTFLGYQEGDFSEAEQACAEVLSLPVWPELMQEEVQFVLEKITEQFRRRM